MSRTQCSFVPLILAVCWAAALPVAAAVPRVNDEGKFFSPVAVERADRKISDIAREFRKELLVETVPGIPDRLQEKYKELGKKAFFEGWAFQRGKDAGLNGIYILICKAPSHLQVEVGHATRQRAFTLEDRDRLVRKMAELLGEHKND